MRPPDHQHALRIHVGPLCQVVQRCIRVADASSPRLRRTLGEFDLAHSSGTDTARAKAVDRNRDEAATREVLRPRAPPDRKPTARGVQAAAAVQQHRRGTPLVLERRRGGRKKNPRQLHVRSAKAHQFLAYRFLCGFRRGRRLRRAAGRRGDEKNQRHEERRYAALFSEFHQLPPPTLRMPPIAEMGSDPVNRAPTGRPLTDIHGASPVGLLSILSIHHRYLINCSTINQTAESARAAKATHPPPATQRNRYVPSSPPGCRAAYRDDP